MMFLDAKRNKFEQGSISKQEYIEEMYSHHSILFEYARYLQHTSIEKIELSDGNVVFTTKNIHAKFLCKPEDMRLPQIEALNFGDYEAEEFGIMRKLIQPGMRVFDVGANVGWFSIQLALLDPTLDIHAFEPIPDTFSWLEKNSALNVVQNVNLHNQGFGSESCERDFFVYPEGSAGSSMADNSKRSSVEKIKCYVERMDEFCAKRKLWPDFIKCDVEGAELFVFQGGLNTITSHKPIVFTEMLRKWAASFDYHPNDIINWFAQHDYRCFQISNNGLLPFQEMDDTTEATNFVFLHSKNHASVIKTFFSRA